MQVRQALEFAEGHVREQHIWVSEDRLDRGEDEASSLHAGTSPGEIYDIDQPMKLSTSAGSLW